MNYYERHLGDYARDTGHLTPLEHGVYNLLLDRYYATEQGIPADQAQRICRARTKEEREAVDAVLEEFFSLQGGVYRQGRVEGEIEKARARIDSARSNGKRGGRPKKNPVGSETETQQKPNGFQLGSETETGLKALQTPDSKQEQEPPCSPPLGDSPPAGKKTRKAKAMPLATYLADCEAKGAQPIPDSDAVWRTAEGAGLPREWVALAWWAFQGRYLANPGDKAKTYASWPQAFRNAVRENWLKLWWPTDDGGYRLSPAGVQAQREMERAA